MAASKLRRTIGAAGLSLLVFLALAPATTNAAPGAGDRCSRAPGPTFYAPGAGKTVALSFDDGPTRFTPQVLRILRNHGVRATFFMTGKHAAARPELLRQVAAEGHLIGGHTYHHDYPSQVAGGWSRRYISSQMRRTNRVLSAATHKPVCFFRPPGGHQSGGMYQAAWAAGTAVVLWSVSSGDWAQPSRTTAVATRNIVRRATAGGSQTHPSVLMHDGKGSHEPESEVSSNRSNTVAALPRIIAYYRSRGYRFVDLAGRSGLPPESTTLRLDATPAEVPASTRSVLTGVATATTGRVVHQDVRWFSRPVGSRRWRPGGDVSSDRTGRFRLGVKPRVDTQYRFLLPRSARYRRAVGTVRVSTFTKATDVTVTGPTTATSGDAVRLEVTMASGAAPRPGVTVLVSRPRDGVVVTDRLRTDAAGRATLVDHPTATTRYTIEVREQLPYEYGSAVHEVMVSPG